MRPSNNPNSFTDSPVQCNSDSGLQNYLYVLILGQLLHGLGGTTLYTVGVGLIDDSVSASSSPMYIGMKMCLTDEDISL